MKRILVAENHEVTGGHFDAREILSVASVLTRSLPTFALVLFAVSAVAQDVPAESWRFRRGHARRQVRCEGRADIRLSRQRGHNRMEL